MDIYTGKGKTGHVQPPPSKHTAVIYVALTTTKQTSEMRFYLI